MSELWTEELTPEEEDSLITKVTEQITKRGLTTPAVFLLESHKPIGRLAGQSMIALSPFLAPFIGMSNVHDYSRLMQSPSSLEKLIVRLEESTLDQETEPSDTDSTDVGDNA